MQHNISWEAINLYRGRWFVDQQAVAVEFNKI